MARALRFQGHLPIKFWGECVLTAGYLINRTPSRVLNGKTPFELLYGTIPTYDYLRVFGSLCYAHIPKGSDKFSERSRRCVFVGYPASKKAWRLYDIETNKFVISRDVVFFEKEFPYAAPKPNTVAPGYKFPNNCDEEENMVDSPPAPYQAPGEMTSPLLESTPPRSSLNLVPVAAEELLPAPRAEIDSALQDDRTSINTEVLDSAEASAPVQPAEIPVVGTQVVEQPTGHAQQARKPPARLQDYYTNTATLIPKTTNTSGTRYPLHNYLSTNRFSPRYEAFIAALTEDAEPSTFAQAMRDTRWREAMQLEIKALEDNQTWTLESLPPEKRALGCKWIYKIKHKSDGSVERFKARLVVLGNR